MRKALGRDPFAEARNREAAIRDKYKPPECPRPALPQPPPQPMAGGIGAPGAPAGANPFGGGMSLGLAPAAPPLGGQQAANPFASRVATTPAAGGLCGAAPASCMAGSSLSSPAPAANPFGAAPAVSVLAFAPGASSYPLLHRELDEAPIPTREYGSPMNAEPPWPCRCRLVLSVRLAEACLGRQLFRHNNRSNFE